MAGGVFFVNFKSDQPAVYLVGVSSFLVVGVFLAILGFAGIAGGVGLGIIGAVLGVGASVLLVEYFASNSDMSLASLFSTRWGWLTVWVMCLVVAVVFTLIMSLAHVRPWTDVSTSRVAWYHQEECEKVDTSGFWLQTLNFWSNFSYLAGGIVITWLSDFRLGKGIGIVLIALSVGSLWFHGTLTEFSQTIDIVGVYAALIVLIGYGFIELIPLDMDGVAAWLIFAGAIILGTIAGFLRTSLKVFDSDYFTPLLVVMLLIYMLMVYLRYRRGAAPLLPPFLAFVGTGILAMVFKFTDGDKNLAAPYGGNYSKCLYAPTSPIQGHALWHILSGLMFVCIFEYIRSVRSATRSVWPWRV